MSRHIKRNLITAFAACVAALALAIPAFSHGDGSHGPKTPAAIGEVVSFTGGVLTVKANNGSTVAGVYSRRSKTYCFRPKGAGTTTTTTTTPTTTTPTANLRNESNGGGDGDGDDKGRGNDKGGNEGKGGEGDENGRRGHGRRGRCRPSNLTPGTKVAAGETVLTSTGLLWKKVVVILPASS